MRCQHKAGNVQCTKWFWHRSFIFKYTYEVYNHCYYGKYHPGCKANITEGTMNMQYSKNGLKLTENFESCRLAAYQDVRGIWTIGWGHTGPEVIEGLVWTQEQADAQLLKDVQSAVVHVNFFVTVTLSQEEFDALVDFTFNAGPTALKTSTLLNLINKGDFKAAAAQFDLWDHASGQVVAGLLRRREAETQEFNS